MISIRLRLLKWLIVPILLINLAGAALTYMLAWIPAQLAFDQSLAKGFVELWGLPSKMAARRDHRVATTGTGTPKPTQSPTP